MAERSEAMITAEGLTVAFGGADVLSRVDLDLFAGEVHALTGENGAGKSTLARAIAGAVQPREGRILLGGRQVQFKNPRQALDSGIALIHQEPLTFPDLTVAENVFAGCHPTRRGFLDWGQTRRRASEILRELGAELDVRRNVGGLSVALQQMVELAAAQAHNPRVWIFDETTAPLTPKEVGTFLDVVRRLRERGCAVLIVSHQLHEVFAIADRITVLRDGKKVACTEKAATTPAEIVRLMVGRELGDEPLRGPGGAGQAPILELEGCSGPGFFEINLSLSPGEVVGLAGLVGSGRTELVRALFGISRLSSGTIRFAGKAVTIRSPRQAASLGIALVPEDRQHDGLLGPQSLTFNTTLPTLRNLSPGGFLKRRVLDEESEEMSGRLRLVHRSPEQPAAELSGGNQQKAVLAKWLMAEPKILILDEPTRGVDVCAKEEVHRLIREQADRGVAVLMVSSDLPEVLRLCDRVAVMRKGRIVAWIDGAEATEESIMRAAAATGHRRGEGS